MNAKAHRTRKGEGGLLTSGELARRCEVSQRAIGFYEQRGLLRPAQRQGEGYRYYDETAVDRVSKIKILQTLGLSLDDIAGVIDLYFQNDSDVAAKRAVITILRAHLGDAERRISELTGFREELVRSIVRLETLVEELEKHGHPRTN